MTRISLAKLFDVLGTRDIPGSAHELQILCTRIGELIELNGENWVQQNRRKLLEEWEYIVRQGLMT